MVEVHTTEVLVFLVVLAAVTWTLRIAAVWYLHRTQVPVSDDSPTLPGEDTGDNELIAVLSAAALSVLSRPVTLKRFRFITTSGANAWSVTGRLNVMGSHLITKRNQ